jgi:hypothetical protein
MKFDWLDDLLQLVWRRCGRVVERGFPASTKVDKVDVGEVVSLFEMATAGKARSKVRVSKATPEMQARIERLERELGELLGAPTKAAADALEATVKGIRRVTFGRGQPTERRVLESVVDELDSLARQQLGDKFTVDDSFRLAKLRGELAKGELLTEAGPMLSLQQTADQLGVSKQAVHKRILNRSLFGIKYREELRIPAWLCACVFRAERYESLGQSGWRLWRALSGRELASGLYGECFT